MNKHEHDQRRPDRLEPQQRLAQEAVRSLGVPEADAAFRARLKEQFVSGAIPDRSPLAVRMRRRRAAVYGWSSLALAAVLALAVFGLNRLPGPELLSARGPGTVTVDGLSVDAGDAPRIAALLKPGARIRLEGETSVDILYRNSLAMRLTPGTDLVLPERPGRWFSRPVSAGLSLGEVSIRTGPGLKGGALRVDTPAGSALITGTLVDVFFNGELSCFCLHDGTAHVLVDGTDFGAIPAMKRLVVHMDSRTPECLDIAPPHLEQMRALDRERGAGLGRVE